MPRSAQKKFALLRQKYKKAILLLLALIFSTFVLQVHLSLDVIFVPFIPLIYPFESKQ
ncbi:MAG: hypothetical protein RMJ44_10930 [Cytophagales bacterium]|nr:hypothetical protein [Cytophagales bacterium]